MTFLLMRYFPKVWLHVSVAILFFVLASCKTSSISSLQDTTRTSIIHDTVRLTDHACTIDSVLIYRYGDTVMIRQHTIERLLKDSVRVVYVRDTLRQEHAQISKITKPTTRVFGIVDYLIILGLAIFILVVIVRRRL